MSTSFSYRLLCPNCSNCSLLHLAHPFCPLLKPRKEKLQAYHPKLSLKHILDMFQDYTQSIFFTTQHIDQNYVNLIFLYP